MTARLDFFFFFAFEGVLFPSNPQARIVAAETNSMEQLERIEHGLCVPGALEANTSPWSGPTAELLLRLLLRSSLRSCRWRKLRTAACDEGGDSLCE